MDEKTKENIVKFFRQILNGIEQEEFYTLADIVNRLDSYHQDMVYTPLEDKQSNNEKLAKDDWDLVAKRYLESDTVEKVLNEIHTKEYIGIISKKEEFEIQDIIKILDEDEMFYKSICEKYVGTMSKEMLIEINNKILHIFIEDKYIKLKEEGKINNQNYTDYLDENFNVYKYDLYQDLYNSTIKGEVAYDLNDLALFDNKGEWVFYISFEELKRMGYGFMVKDQFPLLEEYAIPEEKILEFFDYFSLEQLEDFEQSLNQYFNEKSIVYNENSYDRLESKEGANFNRDILKLA